MFHLLCGYRFSMASKNIDTFDFQQLQLIDFPLSMAVFQHLPVRQRLARLLL
jgi:hypothetical protein